jgi:hypothetical protein
MTYRPPAEIDYRPKQVPLPAILYVGGKSYDVLIVRERRERYQVRLPDGATEPIPIPVSGSAGRVTPLRPGKTTSVPKGMIELVKPPEPKETP